MANSPTISSSRSAIVTSPCTSPYSSTTSAVRRRLRWKLSNCRFSGVPFGMKYGSRIRLSKVSRSSSPSSRSLHRAPRVHESTT